MNPRDWLLVLMALDNAAPIDPVRLQKGMFLFAQESGVRESEAYTFRPYDYGPFSSQIYADLDQLVDEGLVEPREAAGYNWNRYCVTADGLEQAKALVARLDDEERAAARWLADAKRDVLTQSFRRLLKYVYERYPAYAVNSVFTE